jgi:hypothetical protein
MKCLQNRVSITASVDDVWRFLMTEEGYPSWHPLFIGGGSEPSARGRLRVALPVGGLRPTAPLRPTETRPYRKLVWRTASVLRWVLELEYYIFVRPTRRGVRLYHGLILDGALSERIHLRHGRALQRRLEEAGRQLKWRLAAERGQTRSTDRAVGERAA